MCETGVGGISEDPLDVEGIMQATVGRRKKLCICKICIFFVLLLHVFNLFFGVCIELNFRTAKLW